MGRNSKWLRKWLTGTPHFTIFQDGEPYLLRWFILPRNPRFNIYLHKFLKSDEDEALHDHPWWFISLILKGAYWEYRSEGLATGRKYRRAGSVACRRPTTAHRVELQPDFYQPFGGPMSYRRGEKPCWTLFVTGPKVREWGFHCPKGWIPWTKFTSGLHGEHRVGCGEFA